MKINLNNYEEWMVAFLDGELSADELLIFNQFIKKHPELKSELAEFESTILAAEKNIVFENKESLYKKDSALVLLKKAWPIAAAIVLMLAIIPFLQNDTTVQPAVVTTHELVKADTPSNVTSKPATLVEAVIEEKLPQTTIEPNYIAPKKVVANSTPIKKSSLTTVKKEAFENEFIAEKKQVEIIAKEEYIKQAPAPKLIPIKEIETPLEKEITQAPKEIIVQNNLPAGRAIPIFTFKIDEENNTALHQKLNEVATQVEDKIEQIKELKRAPITVCIGNKKLFTLNN